MQKRRVGGCVVHPPGWHDDEMVKLWLSSPPKKKKLLAKCSSNVLKLSKQHSWYLFVSKINAVAFGMFIFQLAATCYSERDTPCYCSAGGQQTYWLARCDCCRNPEWVNPLCFQPQPGPGHVAAAVLPSEDQRVLSGRPERSAGVKWGLRR